MSVEVVEIVTSPAVVQVDAAPAATVEESAPIPGPPGPPGPIGPTGPAGPPDVFRYVHHQLAPAAAWTIAHGLGGYPNATVIDSTGRTIEGADVSYPDADTMTLSFTAAFAGVAYLS